ncbi:CehA/McbA family metallohydrolase [Sphingomonas sp. BK580]|uniref:CehA/McbA family metallohydrolase n=1 Tax=Sphingomonas sp. BK580 TaxID=2586972 RepID=UPI0017D193A6|nr:CehA/McbA family metallohydrolase [Sphingomonas sp. BK580]MBB3695009.1 putative metal-dependent phosphoesterase TrpH [Sphingomonas sp. BK580]
MTVLALLLLAPPAVAQDVTLTGELTRADNETYRAVPVAVPEGVERITLALRYDKADYTVVDLGLWDPTRFRGWSGGARDRVTVATTDATPGYLAGPLPAGTWQVMLGVPNIRAGTRSRYRVQLWFDRAGARAAIAQAEGAPLRAGRAWYRGDLHLHDGNSDGSCATRAKVAVPTPARVPCPLFRTVLAAAAAGLDFVAVTDHNTVAHFTALRELQPWVAPLLLIPGVELTTFHGHANILAPSRFVDFRLAGRAGVAALQRDAHAAGALFSLNHPGLPSGERCMGCGWSWPDTDWGQVDSIEVINGAITTGPLTGLALWRARLSAGDRVTAVAGSDNHDPDAPAGQSPIGRPTTVVEASELSTAAILEGIRAGRAYIDVAGAGRQLELTATAGGTSAAMGGTLPVGVPVRLSVRVAGADGATLRLWGDGGELARRAVAGEAAVLTLDVPAGAARRWIAATVERDGAPLLIGNAIYVAGTAPVAGRPGSTG